MNTRGSEDTLGAAQRRVHELERQLAEHDRELRALESKRKYIAGQLIAVQRRNSKLQAAQSQRAERVSFMADGSGMWSKEVDVLILMLARWDKRNLASLCQRALYRMTDETGERLALGVHKLTGGFHDKLKALVVQETLEASAKHLWENVFTPLKAELLRLNCRLSWNMIGWCNDVWKWDWAALDKDGNPSRNRQVCQLGPSRIAPSPRTHTHITHV